MPNYNPKTEQIKAYQIPEKRPGMNDRVAMKDMIRSGTDVNAFMFFWNKEAGYTLQSARTIYYELKKRI